MILGLPKSRWILYIILLTLIISISSVTIPIAFAQSTPPNDGNWIISDSVTVEDRIIVLNGDLVIEDGGELTLRNVQLKFNCESNREFKLSVEDGGELSIYNSQVSSNTNYNYIIEVDDKGEFNIYNSTLTEYTTNNLPSLERNTVTVFFLIVLLVTIMVVILIFLFYQLSQKKRQIMTTTPDSFIGKTGIVVKTIVPDTYKGKVKIESEIWSATADEKIKQNQKVVVKDKKGIQLIVKKME
jgi:membrane protein implicated in regulation of membrane protease activity